MFDTGTNNGTNGGTQISSGTFFMYDSHGSSQAAELDERSFSGVDFSALGIYNGVKNGNNLLTRWNDTDLRNADRPLSFGSNCQLFRSANTGRSFIGTMMAWVCNEELYATSQRAAVREFCKAYYGVTY